MLLRIFSIYAFASGDPFSKRDFRGITAGLTTALRLSLISTMSKGSSATADFFNPEPDNPEPDNPEPLKPRPVRPDPALP